MTHQQPESATPPEKKKGVVRRFLGWNGRQLKQAYDFKRMSNYDSLKQQTNNIRQAVRSIQEESGETFENFASMMRQRQYNEAQIRTLYKRYSTYCWIFIVSGLLCLLLALWNIGQFFAVGITFYQICIVFSQLVGSALMLVLAMWYGWPAAQMKNKDLFSFQNYLKTGWEMLPMFSLPHDWAQKQ